MLLKDREAFTSVCTSSSCPITAKRIRKINSDSQDAIITAGLPDPNVRSAVEPCPKLKRTSPVPEWDFESLAWG